MGRDDVDRDDRGRRSRDRSSRRSSRSRSRGRRSRSRDRRRSRSHSRERRRSRSRSRGRHRRRDSRSWSPRGHERRDRERRSSRSRSRERAPYFSRSHERRHGERGGGRGGVDAPPRQRLSPTRWQHDRFHSTFTRGGRINEGDDGGGLPYGGGGARPSARTTIYASALMAGLDDDLDAEPYAYEPDGAPSATLRLSGLPEDAQEGDLRALFEPVGGVAGVRLLRDGGGRGGGQAFMDFESAEAAAALMGSDWRDQTFFGPHRLRFEYARPRSAAAAHGDDWECEACQAANFGRRLQCYQCGRGRTPGARPVPAEEPPSCILRVGGLQQATDEETLRFAFVPHAPVRDIRLVRDRHTGELRGVAYVQFYSVEDAGKALAACQDARLDSQPDAPLRLAFARDRFAGDPHHHQAYGGQAPQAAAEAALAYAGWAPKEFGEGGGGAAEGGQEDEDPLAAWERQQAQQDAAQQGQQAQQGGGGASTSAAAGAAAGTSNEESYDPLAAAAELRPQQDAAGAAAAALQQQRAAAEAAGFVYDPASGYLLDPASGYYYDANTGLYGHPQLQQWGTYDFSTGQFVPHDEAVAAAAAAAAAAPGFSSAADSALAMGAAQLAGGRAQHPAARHREQLSLGTRARHDAEAAAAADGAGQQRPRPRRGAVIGASAQLDPQGLMEAARAAEEKVQLLKKQREAEEAKRKRQAAKQAAKQAAQQQQQQQAGGRAGGAAAAPGGTAPAQAGVVHGVIHESSWAAARRQQQQQQQGQAR